MTFFGPDIRNGVTVGLGSVIGFGSRAFTPGVLFAQGEAGVWYDPSDFSTLFTTSAGTTPVTAVEQAVGLSLDKSRGLVLGPELVTNGSNLVNTTGWTPTGSATLAAVGGALELTTLNAYEQARQNITTVVGRSYKITFTTGTPPSDFVYATFGATASSFITAAGTYSFIGVATSTSTLLALIFADGVGTVYFSNISVRELAGTHRIQPSAASRPILRARYNRLTFSEQLDNAAWVKSNSASVTANAVTAPDGTLTADQIDFDASELSRVQQATTGPTASYTFSVWLRTVSGSVSLRFGQANDLDVITVTDTWQRFAVTKTVTGGTDAINHTMRNAAAGGAKTVYAWGADLRSANDTYLPYQRIAAATVYDTVGFPTYLSYDGSDDSMYTGGNLDLSGTDKVTVFAGVTKLSDAALGMLLELSATDSGNNGMFSLLAPLNNATPADQFRSKGTVRVDASTANTFAAPITTALTALGDISGDSALMRYDGVQVAASTGDQGTGNFGSYPLYMGRRNNASLPFNGREFGLIVRGAATSATQIQQTERWMAAKQGRTL